MRARGAGRCEDRAEDATWNVLVNLHVERLSNLGDGDLLVVRAHDRQVVTTIDLGPNWTHHTQPSPDGSILLSANPMTGTLTKIAADEEAETWTPVATMDV